MPIDFGNSCSACVEVAARNLKAEVDERDGGCRSRRGVPGTGAGDAVGHEVIFAAVEGRYVGGSRLSASQILRRP